MGFIRLIYGQPFSQYFDLCGCHYVDRIIKRKKYIDDKCQTVIPDAECVKTEIETLSRSIEDQSFKFHALAENLCQSGGKFTFFLLSPVCFRMTFVRAVRLSFVS